MFNFFKKKKKNTSEDENPESPVLELKREVIFTGKMNEVELGTPHYIIEDEETLEEKMQRCKEISEREANEFNFKQKRREGVDR